MSKTKPSNIAENNTEYPLSKALDLKCGECKYPIGWEANFDADGTSYSGTCGCEDKSHSLYPRTMKYNVG